MYLDLAKACVRSPSRPLFATCLAVCPGLKVSSEEDPQETKALGTSQTDLSLPV